MSDHRTEDRAPRSERGSEPDPAERDEAPARSLRRYTTSSGSRRLLWVVVIVLFIVFLAAPTTKIYLDQQAEIAELEASIEEKSADRDALQDELELWENPDYVEQQAGERLMMVEPGQRSYLVVGADEVGTGAADTSAVEESAGRPAWADALWGSLKDSAWPQRDEDSADSFPELDKAQEDPSASPSPTTETTE
ncbi:FtsB family cell division protein [Kocuria palustris]|uniref:FtsB family cell division protein n=1 Tax=Kocuria palustris TaxID=71999 RepID=UPI0024697D14|nr:septum formation initiator family protein [Kocuria palustris]MDH5151902.1 septum formation initiator family protein [Kocuria palustris]